MTKLTGKQLRALRNATFKDWMRVKYFYLPYPVVLALSIAVVGGLVLAQLSR